MKRVPRPPWQEMLTLPPSLATVTADDRPVAIVKDAAGEWWVRVGGNVEREATPADVLLARVVSAVGGAG